MLSYILNRQYKKITQCLPQSLQQDQPETVYLPSHVNPTLKQATLLEMTTNTDLPKSSKLKIKKKAKVVENTFVGDWYIFHQQSCPSCLSPDNITVKYYSKKHICVNCRKFLRDQHGNLIKLFVNKQSDIICLGIYKMTDQHLKLQEEQMKRDRNGNGKTTQEQQAMTKKHKAWKKIDHKVYYHTDYMKLSLNSKSAFVTFAANDQMVVLLRGHE